MDQAPISDAALCTLAQDFSLSAPEVIADVLEIVNSTAPADELLVWLERRHAWTAKRAVCYMLSVREALRPDA